MPTSASVTRRTWPAADGAGRAWPRSPRSRRCWPDWTSPTSPHRPRWPRRQSPTPCCPACCGSSIDRYEPFPHCGSLARSAARGSAPADADLRSRRDDMRPGESGKVAGVVDAMDGGESAAVPLDLVDAGGPEIQPVQGAKRHAESPAQQDLYRGNVTYHQDGLAAVVPQQPVTGPVDPVCGVGEALPARRCLSGVAPPGCRGCGPSLLDFCQGVAIPVTQD